MKTFVVIGAAVACAALAVPAPAQTVALPGPAPAFAPLEDPALVGLVRQTLEQHPAALAAEAGVSASEALQQAASRPLFNPEIGFDLESADTDDRVLALSQTLDVARQRGARAEVARSERQVAEQQLAAARQSLAVELLSTLADYWTARELDALGVLRVELMQRFADVAQQRQRAGDLNQVDFNVANLAYSQARIERAGAAAALAENEQILRALAPTGMSNGWPGLPADLATIELSEGDAVRLVTAVPEVRIRRERLAVAEAAVTLRDRERQANPTLSLVGGKEEGESLIGLSFTMPLNLRNRFQSEVSAARASRVQSERELDDVTIRARASLEAATQRYVLIHEAWRQWLDTGAPNLAEQTDLLDRLWRSGELGVTDYLVQLGQTLDTQASALELQRRLWIAWFEWLAAAGQVGTWLGLPIEGHEF
jgi:cobalt-zinc-cadmium efflux system outer membrane protein